MAHVSNAPRFHVLVVEPDAGRGANLKQLVECRLPVNAIVAGSSVDAILALSMRVPHVLLVSALLSPQEDRRLMDHVKGLRTARQLAVLTIAPIVDFDDVTQRKGARRGLFWRRRRASASVDCEAVVARIEDALERSRMESHVSNIHLAKGNATETTEPIPQPPADEHVRVTRRIRRQRAQRWTRSELPWLSSAMTSTGVELHVLNISRTGLLAESSCKFDPNSAAEVRLFGVETNIVIPVRFVRSDVAHVDGRGVRYALAAAFQRRLDLVPDQSGSSPRESATPRALADLLVKATGPLGSDPASGGARTIFEQGLRHLAAARDVRIAERPVPSAEGHDGIWFTIPTVDRSAAILQVTFEAGYAPGRDEFALLKASAAAAAVVLQHEASVEAVAAPRRLLRAAD
jgi:hypothetical protein